MFELGNELAVSSGVGGGRVRVDVGKFGPSHRDHFGGGVELHRARPQRDHRAIKGQVFVGQAAQITQHFSFGSVATEYGLAEEIVGTKLLVGDGKL